MTSALTWKPFRGDEAAYSGEMLVAFVFGPARTVSTGKWRYAMQAGQMRGTKSHGNVASHAAAKRQVERNWQRWLDYAGLQPASGETRVTIRGDI